MTTSQIVAVIYLIINSFMGGMLWEENWKWSGTRKEKVATIISILIMICAGLCMILAALFWRGIKSLYYRTWLYHCVATVQAWYTYEYKFAIVDRSAEELEALMKSPAFDRIPIFLEDWWTKFTLKQIELKKKEESGEAIILKLKARHFKDTFFTDCRNCAISKALKDKFRNSLVTEHVSSSLIDGRQYSHRFYGNEEFRTDKKRATKKKFDDTVIRTIVLIKEVMGEYIRDIKVDVHIDTNKRTIDKSFDNLYDATKYLMSKRDRKYWIEKTIEKDGIPEEDGMFLVTLKDKHGEESRAYVELFAGMWVLENIPNAEELDLNVISYLINE